MVRGLKVDLQALSGLTHHCQPALCRHASKCCNSYEVFVGPREQRRIIGHLNDAARYAKALREEGGYTDPFEETEGGKCLATHEDGLCLFAFRRRGRPVLCSLHAAAEDHGLHPYRLKPMACSIWPLYFLESDPPVLTVQEGVIAYPCNARRRSRSSGLDSGVAGIIRDFWGPELLAGIQQALRDNL